MLSKMEELVPPVPTPLSTYGPQREKKIKIGITFDCLGCSKKSVISCKREQKNILTFVELRNFNYYQEYKLSYMKVKTLSST